MLLSNVEQLGTCVRKRTQTRATGWQSEITAVRDAITSTLYEEPGWHPDITAFSNQSVSSEYLEINTSRGIGRAVFAGAFGEGPDGELYFLTTRRPVPVGNTGAMWKLTPAD